MNPSSKTPQRLDEMEDLLSRNPDAPILLEPKQASAPLLSYYLGTIRGQRWLSETVTHEFEEQKSDELLLESARNQIRNGSLTEAKTLLEKIQAPSPEVRGEVLLEQCRILLFQGKFEELLTHSEVIDTGHAITPVTRMTFYQIRGHALFNLKSYSRAIEELKKATPYVNLYPGAPSAFSVRGFLVLCYCALNQKQSAEQEIESMRRTLSLILNEETWVDRLLTLIRSEVYFARTFESQEIQNRHCEESLALSLWLKDQPSLEKCALELGIEPDSVNNYPYSKNAVIRKPCWFYFPRHDLILEFSPRHQVLRLDGTPRASQVFRALLNGPMSYAELFETVWKIPYSSDRHATYLRASLSKFRKRFPKGSIRVKDEIVTLS